MQVATSSWAEAIFIAQKREFVRESIIPGNFRFAILGIRPFSWCMQTERKVGGGGVLSGGGV